MTREQILHLYQSGRWFRANGQLLFLRMAIDAYNRGLIQTDEYEIFGINLAQNLIQCTKK